MSFGIYLKPMDDYVLSWQTAEDEQRVWHWVCKDNPEARRFSSREAAERMLTRLPLRIRKDAAICEFSGNSKP